MLIPLDEARDDVQAVLLGEVAEVLG
jgi:hypothetical protein